MQISLLLRFALLLLITLMIACSPQEPSSSPDPTVQEASESEPEASPENDPPEATERTDVQESGQSSAPAESVYTELSAPTCSVETFEEPPGSLLKCLGPGDFGLLAHDEDARVSLTLVDAQGQESPLEFWRTVTAGFSAFGPRVEWRIADGNPQALIVRVNTYENPDDPDKTTSYLVVAKISPSATCVVAKIPPSQEQNVEAREAADDSAERSCL